MAKDEIIFIDRYINFTSHTHDDLMAIVVCPASQLFTCITSAEEALGAQHLFAPVAQLTAPDSRLINNHFLFHLATPYHNFLLYPTNSQASA